MKTEIFKDDLGGAADMIRAGGLVAVPTETVYGLAGNGLDGNAVERIYEVKGRPTVKPLALMVPDAAAMDAYCESIPEQARFLAKKFWPGPLSIVLKSKDNVPEIVRAGGETVSLRCPDHPMTLELLRLTHRPLAAPSANPSGMPSPKNAETVREYFEGRIDGIIDGGECGIGLESTIIDMSKTPYRILRQGSLPEADIKKALAGNMLKIGITGGSASGKTTALRELEKRGAFIIDCDEVYHRLLESDELLLYELREQFPAAFIDGRLDRKALGTAVFGNEEQLKLLNGITHGRILQEVDRLLEDAAMNGGTLAAIDAVALIESGFADRCDVTVGVVAPRELRIDRIMARDGVSRSYAESRIDAQKPTDFYYSGCDLVLEGDKSEKEFISYVNGAFDRLLQKINKL